MKMRAKLAGDPPGIDAPAASAPRKRRDAPIDALIAIGSSTGGIDALHVILSAFPADCPPTLVVQHISGPFSVSFAKGLAGSCRARVQLAEEAAPLLPGHIYIAGGNSHHLTVSSGSKPICRLQAGPPIAGHRPSIDALFRSCAAFGPAVRAALLTGMGRDGAEGLLEIRNQGGRTCAQNAETSLVFGMARVALGLGAVEALLPLERIAAALIRPHTRKAEAT